MLHPAHVNGFSKYIYVRTKIQTFSTGGLFCGKDLDFSPAVKVDRSFLSALKVDLSSAIYGVRF